MSEPTLTVVLLGAQDEALVALRRALDQSGLVMVIGAAGELSSAVRLVRERRPAVALARLESRAMVAQVEGLMREAPLPVVVLARTRELGAAALAAGALEVLDLDAPPKAVIDALRLMSQLKVVSTRRDELAVRGPARAPALPAPTGSPPRPPLVVIGASTGGPAALCELLGQLPADLPAPVLVAQHMPSDYDQTFAAWLGSVTRLAVEVGHAQHVKAGTLYLAPSARDLVLGPGGVLETRLAERRRPIPSVDALFESVARTSAWALCGVVLSGMGTDGAAGLLAIRRAGGLTMVQDRRSSVVASMPEEALARGASEFALPPGMLGQEVLQWVRQQATRVAQGAHGRVS